MKWHVDIDMRTQVDVDIVDASIANAAEAGLQLGSHLQRTSDRISLTVRRVLHVRRNLVRL